MGLFSPDGFSCNAAAATGSGIEPAHDNNRKDNRQKTTSVLLGEEAASTYHGPVCWQEGEEKGRRWPRWLDGERSSWSINSCSCTG